MICQVAVRRLTLPALLLNGSLAGCSPYVFTEEVTAFDKAVGNLNTAALDFRNDLAAAPGERAFWAAYDAPGAVALQRESCLRLDDEACFVLVDGQRADAPNGTEAELAKAIGNIRALASYAAALKAITDAAARETFDGASARLANAVGGFVGLIPGPAAAGAAAVKTAIRTGGLIAGASLDHARRRQLEISVARVETVMPAAAREIARGLVLMRDARIDHRYLVGDAAAEALRAPRTDRERRLLIQTVTASAAEIRALKASDPAGTAGKLAKAHTALADALASAEPDPEATLATIQTFVAAADELKRAIVAL